MKKSIDSAPSRRNQAAEVTVRLSSGLGNQLFQLAYGLWMASRRNATLSFDTTWFQLVSGVHPVRRSLRLNEFTLDLPEAFHGIRRLAVGLLATLYDKNRRGLQALSALGKMRVMQEGVPSDPRDGKTPHDAKSRCYLNGYWQLSEPFLTVRESLLEKLVPKHPLSAGAEKYVSRTKSESTGFLHVRRGDYSHFMGESGMLPATYYADALSVIAAAGAKMSRWLVFSEDAAWAKANLQFVTNAELVDYASPQRDIEDLMIMKACSAGIIANSSYSWWGAAMGEHRNRPIVTPDRYSENVMTPNPSWPLPNWKTISPWP